METEYVAVHEKMIKQNRNVTLNADIMLVNVLPFLITHGKKVGLVTAVYLPENSGRHIAQYYHGLFPFITEEDLKFKPI